MIHLSRELSLRPSRKAYLWLFSWPSGISFVYDFLTMPQTMIDEVAPWTLALWPKSKSKSSPAQWIANEIETKNKFSIDNKGKSTQTGINFGLFRANFDTQC